MDNLAATSEGDHFYYHYLRYDTTPASYNEWDVWCWPYKEKAGQGVKFDWVGRTTSSDYLSATGDAIVDSFGYAHIDVDLNKTDYKGGWDNASKTMGEETVSFAENHANPETEWLGLQIVKSETRTSGSGFWTNDSGDLKIPVADYALENDDGTTSYHCFVVQDQVQSPSATPLGEIVDPFEEDDGTNETYNNEKYNDVDFSITADKAATSPEFLKGNSDGVLKNGAGVGYQIMVSSFCDSDGDGFGDIYGIYQKLDYIEGLNVNVLWLTPIQASDSYHGYDITDYLSVDPRYGSSVSDAAKANGGSVTSKTAAADYKQLLDECHKRGIAVIMDLVINHTSTGNKWFIDSAQLHETMRGYYRWANHETGTDITQENCWYPYGDHVYSYYAKFGSGMPELNYSYTGTREAVKSIIKNWCEIGVDGFRIDAVKHIYMRDEVAYEASDTYIVDEAAAGDYSSDLTKNLHFWRDINADLKKDYPNAFIVGENFDGHAYHVAPFYEGFDSLFDFYSYFNLTSIAARAQNGGNSGAYQGNAYGFLGANEGKNGGQYTAASDSALAGSDKSITYSGYWNLFSVLNTYNQYRGGSAIDYGTAGEYTAINGTFTSNHDIARSINRVAATSFNADGIASQGRVTSSNYETLNKAATCVQIAQLMLPGLTWIYYGDELGMTGNFPNGITSTSSYADVYYRQPMKWEDSSERPAFDITGSSESVALDDINASSLVSPAETQAGNSSSHYSALAGFAQYKSTEPTLIRGAFTPYDWKVNNQTYDYMVNFVRKMGNEEFQVVVNLGPTDCGAGFEGYTTLASYNGATPTFIPAYSALLLKKN